MEMKSSGKPPYLTAWDAVRKTMQETHRGGQSPSQSKLSWFWRKQAVGGVESEQIGLMVWIKGDIMGCPGGFANQTQCLK